MTSPPRSSCEEETEEAIAQPNFDPLDTESDEKDNGNENSDKTKINSVSDLERTCKKRKLTVHTDPDWLENLRTGWDNLILNKVSETSRNFYNEDVDIKNKRERRTVRREFMDAVTDHIFGLFKDSNDFSRI